MKILILGAAGQISKLLTDDLLARTDNALVLYGRNATKRLRVHAASRVQIVDGDFKDRKLLKLSMQDVDVVYLNSMHDSDGIDAIIDTMQELYVKRIIVASILGIYDEVPGAFGAWNKSMVGVRGIKRQATHAAKLEKTDLDYTILRLTWLYNQKGNRDYRLTQKGEPFVGAQVTREAVAQLIVDIIADHTGQYNRTSLGVSEPNTNWDKPSFY
ncbi:NAD(P)H-binding protein [Fibrella sp. ES10-3-2-2]|nr:hypothetical protein A6C57_12610 [Fibrella sp. ES10-3-2-2]